MLRRQRERATNAALLTTAKRNAIARAFLGKDDSDDGSDDDYSDEQISEWDPDRDEARRAAESAVPSFLSEAVQNVESRQRQRARRAAESAVRTPDDRTNYGFKPATMANTAAQRAKYGYS